MYIVKLIFHLTLNIDLGRFLFFTFPYTLFIMYNEFVEWEEFVLWCEIFKASCLVAALGEQLKISDKGYN